MFCYPAFRYLICFHVTDNEKFFSNSVSWVLLFLPGSFLKDGYLHLLLIDLVMKEENLLVFVIGIHFRKTLQISFSGSPRESGGKDGCLDYKCDCGVNDFDIVCHGLCLELNRMLEIAN